MRATRPASGARWWRPATDLALALGSATVDVLVFSGLPLETAGIVQVCVITLALCWRRHSPMVVLAVVCAVTLSTAVMVTGYRPLVAPLLALGTLAALRGWREATTGLLLTLATTTPTAIVQEVQTNQEDSTGVVTAYITAVYILLAGGAFGVGRWVRVSVNRLDRAERASQQRATEAVRDERRRIARELHDIVSHSVSVMVLQSAGARRVIESDPRRATEALATIEAIGKESMVELRRLLGVLDEDGSAAGVTGERQHGLADVAELVRGLRLSGLEVTMVEEGSRARLEPSVDLSAYRIVQEALTNSIKHGHGASVVVTVSWSPRLLTLEVVDDGGMGRAPVVLSTEHGLPGMRERARAVGGRLDAGPLPAGGFRVAATLPVAAGNGGEPGAVAAVDG